MTPLRERIVTEARGWLGTRWLHEHDVKGVGVDCVYLLIRVYHAVGLIPDIDPGTYPSGWSLRDDRYLAALMPYVAPSRNDPPAPGDLAVFRIGKHPAHAGIVSEWPRVIHADGIRAECVVETRVDQGALASRFVGAFTVQGC